MKTLLLSLLLGAAVSVLPKNQSKLNVDEPIKAAIQTYADGGATRNIDQIATVLNPEFRVVLNRFRGNPGTMMLTRDAYLEMMRDGKIGGTTYELEFIHLNVYKHTADAEVWYRSEKADIHNFFWLVQNEQNTWQLVSTMAVNESK